MTGADLEAPAVALESESGVAVVGLTRPEKRNAMRLIDCQRVGDLVAELGRNPDVRAIIVTGHGGSFSAGADLRRLNVEHTDKTLLPAMHRTVLDIYRCPKPVLAAVAGCCVGAGWALALACDVIVAESDAYFQLPFTSRGLIPDAGVSWFLQRGLTRYEMTRLLWFDGRMSAAEAAARGLVTEVTEPGNALSRTRELAVRLVNAPARSVRVAKTILRNGVDTQLDAVLDAEYGHIAYNQGDEEVTGRLSSFVTSLGRKQVSKAHRPQRDW